MTETAVMYPDISVTCRPLAPDDDRLSDPTVVAEVFSPTTETHDGVRKWREYRTIATLRQFVLVAQDQRRVEVDTRSRTGGELAIVEPPEDAVALKAVAASLSLEAIYQGSGRLRRPLDRTPRVAYKTASQQMRGRQRLAAWRLERAANKTRGREARDARLLRH